MSNVRRFAVLLSLITGFIPNIVGQTPETFGQLMNQGRQYAAERKFDKALEAYTQAAKLDPNSAEAQVGMGSVLNNMGRAGDALEPSKRAVELDPKSAGARINLGVVNMNLRRVEQALSEFNEAKALTPNNPQIYTYLGSLMLESKRFEDALSNYKKAAELAPTFAWNFHNIGLTYMQMGRFQDAVEPLTNALRLDPNYKNARFHLSNAFTSTGRYRDAIDSWTKFLELVPNGADALSSRAWDYLYEGSSGRDAALDAQKFLSLYGWRTNSSPFQAFIAIIGFRSAGMEPEAQAMLQQMLKKANPDAWPYDIGRYLAGEISADDLLKIAASNDQKTEAHTYVGMDCKIKGDLKSARIHFQWVKDFGNRRFLEFPLAVAELGRLSN